MGPSSGQQRPNPTSILEWAFAGLGMVLVAATIGYMVWYGITHPETPPQISVTPTATSPMPEGYLVEFTARNHGNSTAAGLLVSGRLLDGSEVIEESETTVTYLPQQSERKGGLIFENDPRDHTLRLLANGYEHP
ncbi:TIGR02588 family protein [Pelagibacterium montanilacus]|uniref:TIGR02588 family protein n=1 Tax=Pelagibacterium montanilacus TaxID=2185280 RepID=UPI000F8E0C2F|nr:TIGR02588 family protein [Pelagibacterium montanilacus]